MFQDKIIKDVKTFTDNGGGNDCGIWCFKHLAVGSCHCAGAGFKKCFSGFAGFFAFRKSVSCKLSHFRNAYGDKGYGGKCIFLLFKHLYYYHTDAFGRYVLYDRGGRGIERIYSPDDRKAQPYQIPGRSGNFYMAYRHSYFY